MSKEGVRAVGTLSSPSEQKRLPADAPRPPMPRLPRVHWVRLLFALALLFVTCTLLGDRINSVRQSSCTLLSSPPRHRQQHPASSPLLTTMRPSFSSIALLVCGAGALTTAQAASVPLINALNDTVAAGNSTLPAPLPANSSAPVGDGFVNNGTVGSYPCVVGTATTNQVAFLSDTVASACPDAQPPVYPYNKIHIRSPDDSVRATFLPYGATLSEFWVKDRNGTWRDIVLGFDNSTNFGTDAIHPNFGPQVGRYANRIKNGTFEVDGQTYNTPLNENNVSTLHGGTIGYDRTSYIIESLNSSSVSFINNDADGNQGFPGAVVARASYSLLSNATLQIQMAANVTGKRSPVMLSHHVYWALHAYQGANDTILNHTLHLPRADKFIETDSILIPTGPIPSVNGTPYDFTTPRTFAERFNETQGVCGAGCQGWDSCFVMSNHTRDEDILTLSSPETGIQMSVKTDQDAIQIYTCDGISAPDTKGSLPRKRAHGGDGTLSAIYDNHSCVVIEMEDYIDGINNPAWGRDQIYSSDRPYSWNAEYTFTTAAA